MIRTIVSNALRSSMIPRATITTVVSQRNNNNDHNNHNNNNHNSRSKSNWWNGNKKYFATASLFCISLAASSDSQWLTNAHTPGYVEKVRAAEANIRNDIAELLDGGDYDGHGSYGPIFIRLAWHSSGSYDKNTNTGGSNGALMRFEEGKYGGNNGLQIARQRLESIKEKYPFISYADLWILAGIVACEEMGGPVVAWRPGRSDYAPQGYKIVPDGRLPDGARGADHIRDIFYRMGFNDREIVALNGAHAFGKTHKQNSGFDGPWTRAPTTFSNEFFRLLLEEEWSWRKNWDGNPQYENQAKDLMMLPTDIAFITDPTFRKYVELYAKDEEVFAKDFANAFCKLTELGVPFPKSSK